MAILGIVKLESRRGRKLAEKLDRRGEGVLDAKVVKQARRIVDDVRAKGDKALLAAARRYDGATAKSVGELRETPARTDRRKLPPGFEHALERAIVAVERYHDAQRHDGFRLAEAGVELIERRRPLRRVGIYVPGGRATYPSTVVMTVVPAKLAGVEEIVVATPRAAWDRSPALRHSLERLGVREVWTLGGAHAVAALAYGTETVPRVDKIVGPGNAWVTAGKSLVQGDVAIDGLAGPSEVVIVASGPDVAADLVAADLLAQAEHDPQATAILVTDQPRLAKDVNRQLKIQLADLATAATAKESLQNQGAAVLVPDMESALRFVERVAPEHLQLVGPEAEALEERVRNAGAIFVGAATPEVFGDYLAGPSHVLPTAGTARFTSALGVEDFVRRSHTVRFTTGAAARCAAAAGVLADVEGLPAHAVAARKRGRFGDDR